METSCIVEKKAQDRRHELETGYIAVSVIHRGEIAQVLAYNNEPFDVRVNEDTRCNPEFFDGCSISSEAPSSIPDGLCSDSREARRERQLIKDGRLVVLGVVGLEGRVSYNPVDEARVLGLM